MSRSYPRRREGTRGRMCASRRRARAVVIAPHPDDDVIGCGALLQRLARGGARITVIYVTDGSASHLRSRRFPPAVLRDIREGEARAALAVLGIRATLHFLRVGDGTLALLAAPQRTALVERLRRLIDGRRADLVLSPWRRDPHPDHIATAALTSRAVAACAVRPQTLMYGVWLDIRGNAGDHPHTDAVGVVDLRLTPRERSRKEAAIMAHRSQTGALVDDDPDGFCIDAPLLERWLAPIERFYRPDPRSDG